MRFPGLLIAFFVVSLFLSHHAVADDPLPKWMTEEEKASWEDYLRERPEPFNTTPPDTPPRTPAEFEEAQAVIITWAAYSSELREIVRHAQSAVEVYIITNNQSNVESYLTSGNVPLDNIVFVNAPFNSVWVRDYGPQSVYLDGTDELAFIDWDYNRPRPQDNQIPQFMANYLDLDIYQLALGNNLLTATGGNFMADGFGRGFSSKLILTENSGFTEEQIDLVKYEFQGIHTYIKMDELPFDNISHLDMHMKLLDEETLLVGEFPEGVSDGPFIESNLEYLTSNYLTAYDRPFEVVRIPMAPSPTGNYPPNAHYRTYTNSIILNNVVLVPVYGSYLDADALEVYEEAMPGYEIVGINMDNVISASGAIHCVTREIMADDPIHIAHAKLHDQEASDDGFEIKATINTVSGIDEAKVYWSLDSDNGFETIDMVLENDTFYAHIPPQPCLTEISYYISATNVNDKTINKPLVAPDGYYTFTILGEETDFYADDVSLEMGEATQFHLTYCQEPDDVSWDFGQGAEPATAEGTGPHTVTYHEPGAKTVSVAYDGEEIIKEDYIVVNEANGYLLLVKTEGEGTTNPDPGEYEVFDGDEFTLEAIAGEGWQFVKWRINNDEDQYNEQITLTVESNLVVTAVFEDPTTDIPFADESLRHNIYPNPSQGNFTLSLSPSNTATHLTISGLHGEVVFEEMVAASTAETMLNINLDNVRSGIYIVHLTNGKELITEKIVVQ